jgi:hypothetical protein
MRVADAVSRPRPESRHFAVANSAFVDLPVAETVFLYKRLPSARPLSSYAVPQTVNSTRALPWTAGVEFPLFSIPALKARAATSREMVLACGGRRFCNG